MEFLAHLVLTLAASPWAYLVLAGLLIVDGFFPFVPGETLVVSLAVLSAGAHGPNFWAVLAISIVASTIGDATAFLIGRRVGVERWGWMRRRRVVAAFGWARRGISDRPAMLLMTAKFVPVGRVAVTMTAGATGFPLRRYLPIAAVASAIYTAFHVAVGVLAGAWLAHAPLVAVAVGLLAAFTLGFLIDLLVRLFRRRGERGQPDQAAPR